MDECDWEVTVKHTPSLIEIRWVGLLKKPKPNNKFRC